MSLRRITLAIAASATLIPSQQVPGPPPAAPPDMTVPQGAAAVEQTSPGTRESAQLVASFDGLGGLHADRNRSRRRLHDLVRRRLLANRRHGLLEPHRRVPNAGLRRQTLRRQE
jgi:hypothetical protein